MKKIKAFAIIVLFLGFLISTTSCVVVPRQPRADNGNHKGWHKSSVKANNSNSFAPGKAKKGYRK